MDECSEAIRNEFKRVAVKWIILMDLNLNVWNWTQFVRTHKFDCPMNLSPDKLFRFGFIEWIQVESFQLEIELTKNGHLRGSTCVIRTFYQWRKLQISSKHISVIFGQWSQNLRRLFLGKTLIQSVFPIRTMYTFVLNKLVL